MAHPPRVALFADCFHEVNGAALSCRQLAEYAANHDLPFLSVHSGPRTELIEQGSVLMLELKRGRATFPVDNDFGCDPLLWRYAGRVTKVLEEFQPDLVHVISPGDFGRLGVRLGHRLGIPIVGSYHTQLHEYAATRMRRSVAFLPTWLREPIVNLAQEASLQAMTLFYRIPRLLLAPTPEICQWLGRAASRPCRLMGRGVDTAKFSPAWRDASDGVFRLGYVGRLTADRSRRRASCPLRRFTSPTTTIPAPAGFAPCTTPCCGRRRGSAVPCVWWCPASATGLNPGESLPASTTLPLPAALCSIPSTGLFFPIASCCPFPPRSAGSS